MDRHVGRKIPASGRNRVPSNNNSTLTTGGTRGTSTPTGSISKNRSCNFSPITNPDVVKPTPNEKSEPKILKSLGPSFPQNTGDKKNSCSKARSAEEQATLLYMAYQQQHFLNDALQDAKAKVDEGCQKQLEDLWNLVRMKESYVKQMEDRISLVKNHSKASHLIDHLEPSAVEATNMASSITSITQNLAKALDLKLHQISFDDMNPLGKDEMKKLVSVMEDSSKLCKKLKPDSIDEAASTSRTIFRLDENAHKMTQLMAECQRVSASTVTRLGQEILLAHEDDKEYKSVSDIYS